MGESSTTTTKSAKDRKLEQILKVSTELDLDPIHDVELFWIVEEYLSAPLPANWSKIKTPTGEETYVNSTSKITIRENPVKPRFKKLVQLMRHCESKKSVLDEVSVLELWTPIAKVQDILDMARYLKIDAVAEPHLLWIAKLAILEGLPEGWKEVRNEDGTTSYLNTLTNQKFSQHPLDDHFEGLIRVNRSRGVPQTSLRPDLYEWQPEIKFDEVEFKPEEKWLHRRVHRQPASGKWIPYLDVLGERIWYNLETKKETTDLYDIKILPAALCLQRSWRSYTVRRDMWRIHKAALVIGKYVKQRRFRKFVKKLQAERKLATVTLQKYRLSMLKRVEASKVAFERLGSIGSRPGRKAKANVSGIMSSGYSFRSVRRKVIHIQRAYRAYLERKRVGR
ncbi:hypothetical protein HOP50_15g74390 [Chloropicon primus]|uniref:WW domain-containing protein n=1 Tax=Chloropicon primus TaxID=1764295 RepID=A0A5B8MYZ7_9CHLO|nr:hypothetical protein A3770_15p74130 [Chloropicon primus]UPR04105.1 hypothetical protein HOP50_15g74390 [Chloropicon primus]|eukprot:QDZ24895.1 hypothetical protein A3770_15p74130 [Chloropicon primus]